jgi:endonuclease III
LLLCLHPPPIHPSTLSLCFCPQDRPHAHILIHTPDCSRLQDKLGGRFPETAVGLRQVPGVGPYTAAAVASIAFNDSAAAVDGNVVRVLSRLQRLTDPKPGKVHDVLAGQLLHPERPGCHNQVGGGGRAGAQLLLLRCSCRCP